MQKKQCLDRAPQEKGASAGAVLLRPLAGLEGAAWFGAPLVLVPAVTARLAKEPPITGGIQPTKPVLERRRYVAYTDLGGGRIDACGI